MFLEHSRFNSFSDLLPSANQNTPERIIDHPEHCCKKVFPLCKGRWIFREKMCGSNRIVILECSNQWGCFLRTSQPIRAEISDRSGDDFLELEGSRNCPCCHIYECPLSRKSDTNRKGSEQDKVSKQQK